MIRKKYKIIWAFDLLGLFKNPLSISSNANFRYAKDFPTNFITFFRILFFIKKLFRWLRIQRFTTNLLGFQYHVSSNLIEIDLTYLCNLRCNNCNRSSAQAPEAVHIDLNLIKDFVDESIVQNRKWLRIRLLGGEPTLHPDFERIINELLRYKSIYPQASIQVVTNGYGAKVQAALASLPSEIYIENSSKTNVVQQHFGPFNLAPQDSKLYRWSDYRNGCVIPSSCGLGLTPQGYYPCALAGGIDRVLGLKRGRKQLPVPNDEMRDLMDIACRLCGRFKDGHYIPEKLRPPLLEQKTSNSWHKIYAKWQERNIPKE